MATRYVPGDTGRPVSVCPDQRHSVAPSSSGTGGPTWRTGPGAVLNRRIFFFCPGAKTWTTASPPPGTGSSSGRGTVSLAGPIDVTRGRGGVVSSRTDSGMTTLRPWSASVIR